MKYRLIIAYIGNLIDTISTLHFTSIGFHEINPIMRWLLRWPVLFIIGKIAAMTAAVQLFWRTRNEKTAVVASWLAYLLYGGLALYYTLAMILKHS